MAVTTSVEFVAKYQSAGSNVSGCFNGGTDYRTLSKDKNYLLKLYAKGWAGENISDACKVTEVALQSFEARVRTTSNLVTVGHYGMNVYLGVASGTASGEIFTETTLAKVSSNDTTINNSSDWRTLGDGSFKIKSSGSAFPSDASANKLYPTIGINIWEDYLIDVRAYIRNIKFKVTRTRACYITFKGTGIIETKTMYDYGTVPSFGSTPTRDGYTFAGWSNGSTIYTGTLPKAYETDVTYTAVWELAKTNKIYIGTAQPKNIYVGNQEVKAVYVGTTKIYG